MALSINHQKLVKMKALKFKKIFTVNIILYIFLSLIALGVLFSLIGFVNDIFINPKNFEKLSMGSIDIPIMRPYEDTFFYIEPDELIKDGHLEQQLQKNEYIFSKIHGVISAIIFILLLLQLRKLIVSIKKREFYNQKSVANVKNIAYLLFFGVLVDFIAYQCLQLVIPLSKVVERINYITLREDFFTSLMFSVDLSKLLIAFTFLSISIVFKESLTLKEQADFTI